VYSNFYRLVFNIWAAAINRNGLSCFWTYAAFSPFVSSPIRQRNVWVPSCRKARENNNKPVPSSSSQSLQQATGKGSEAGKAPPVADDKNPHQGHHHRHPVEATPVLQRYHHQSSPSPPPHPSGARVRTTSLTSMRWKSTLTKIWRTMRTMVTLRKKIKRKTLTKKMSMTTKTVMKT
jgi:hypothetical protein